jgi:hypothetical protein
MEDGIMAEKNLEQCKEQAEPIIIDGKEVDNVKRTLTMLEKALERVLRRNYYNRDQYPPLALEIEDQMKVLRGWVEDYQLYSSFQSFRVQVGLAMKELESKIGQLMVLCKPSAGKRRVKKNQQVQEHLELCKSIDAMLDHIAEYLEKWQSDTVIGIAIEKGLQRAFENHCIKKHEKERPPVSGRGEKTYIFACASKEEYLYLVNDKRRFTAEVVDKLNGYPHATGHKSSCRGPKEYVLIGFRPHDRKIIMPTGQQERFPVRMVKCKNCEERFSLLPSFLPREKHFTTDVIGQVFQNVLLFSQSIQSALHNLTLAGVRSKQTIFNWLRWIGTIHPAAVLTRAGVAGSGYLQEDEGFEKEPNLRTYSVVMVEPKTLLVWHADYVDHVDEKTLCSSFEEFLQRVSFKVIGVTKDKWEASTKALKAVFKGIWIGFCHRHCLKKFRQALVEYQEQIQCTDQERSRLYKVFKKVLESSTSQISVEVKLKSLREAAFNHPLLKVRLDELKENASHYTCHKKREGITKTTSIVDNFLKLVKRKLTMAESFRDKGWSQILFRAMANTRNFVPFLPGAKNAHKSPFILAQGETHDLPWIQVMNFHNAFLFTANAY